MQRVKRSTAVAVLPADPAGGTPGYFPLPDPAGGVPAAVPGYEWYNNVQEEICSVIAAAGVALDGTNRAQMLAALRAAGVFTTPARFDNTTKAATTSFVSASGLQFSSVTRMYSGSTQLVLVAADVGSSIGFNASVAQSVVLPAVAGLPIGATIRLVSGNLANRVTITSAAGATNIDTMAGLVSSLILQQGEDIIVTWQGTSWMCSGSYVFRAIQLGGDLVANGYQKLSSGLIIQWGFSSPAGAGTVVSVTLPIAYPNNHLVCFGSSSNNTAYAGATKISVSQIGVFGSATANNVFWLSIGN